KPRNESRAAITKVEGNKITVKKLGTFREQAVLMTVADQAKEVNAIVRQRKYEPGEAVDRGLQNDLFATARAGALLLANAEDVVVEVRVLPRPYWPGGDAARAKPELQRVVGHGDLTAVACVAFSPDGKRVVTGTRGEGGHGYEVSTVRLWET